jgi:adenylate cyclase
MFVWMRLALVVLGCLLALTVFSGDGAKDSLWVVWRSGNSDSLRIEAVTELINEYYLYQNPDSADLLASDLQRFGEKVNNATATFNGLRLKGTSAIMKSDFIAARAFLEKSYTLSVQLNDLQKQASVLRLIGVTLYYTGNYSSAVSYLSRSLEISEKLGDMNEIGDNLTTIGVIYHIQKDFQRAVDYHLRAVKIGESRGEVALAGALMNLGVAYKETGEFAKAIECYQRCLGVFEKGGLLREVARALHNLGDVYQAMGNTNNALDYFNQSLVIKESTGDRFSQISTYLSIGELNITLGNVKEGLKNCSNAERLAQELDNVSAQLDACECLYEAHRAVGNHSMALVYLEKKDVLRDSLDATETTKRLEQMEYMRLMKQDSLTRDFEAKQIELAHQMEIDRKNTARNLWIGGVLISLIGAGVVYYRFRRMRRSKRRVELEFDKSENLLQNILPADVARELKEKGKTDARNFDEVTILFTDFKSFTEKSSAIAPEALIQELNECFAVFDRIIEKHQVEKIKTIGDAYMAAGGLPAASPDSALRTVHAALDMQQFIHQRRAERESRGEFFFEMRVGIHTGPVVAGIVGVKKIQYDIWGDTVNTASRMESSGEPGEVNISNATYDRVKDARGLAFVHRGLVPIKGKGEIEMWFVRATM